MSAGSNGKGISSMCSVAQNLILAGALCSAELCSAATINALASFFTIDAGNGNLLLEQEQFFFVPRFNPGLGTLDAITISVTRGAVNATIGVDNESPFSAAAFADDVSAAAFTEVSYAGGTLAESAVSIDIGPSPGVFLLPDSDGAPDFTGSDFLSFTGPIPTDSFDQSIVDSVVLNDFTGTGSRLITLTISEIGGSTIPGLQGLTASYGPGIGVIGLTYEYTAATVISEPGVLYLLLTVGIASTVCARSSVRRESR